MLTQRHTIGDSNSNDDSIPLGAWQFPREFIPAVAAHNQRGTAEQWIKEGKAATHWTRRSCHRFRANEVRLLLGVIAYNLGNLLRRLVLPSAIQDWSLSTGCSRPAGG